jgi:hypothetical protein
VGRDSEQVLIGGWACKPDSRNDNPSSYRILQNLHVWPEKQRFHLMPKTLPVSPMSAVIAQFSHTEKSEKWPSSAAPNYETGCWKLLGCRRLLRSRRPRIPVSKAAGTNFTLINRGLLCWASVPSLHDFGARAPLSRVAANTFQTWSIDPASFEFRSGGLYAAQ